MNIDRIYNIPGAMSIKRDVERIANDLVKYDNMDRVDLSKKEGEVVISLREMKNAGLQEAVKVSGSPVFTDRIQFAHINYDVKTREVKAADIKTIRVFNSAYGEGIGEQKHFRFEEKKADGRNVQVFYECQEDPQTGDSCSKAATVDKYTGRFIKYELID
ncbi:MAG: hypothetical protein LWY06_02995 [Firmicutes bacterium]|nr:hypothetical protein [Bacillota bacterium]